MIKIKVQIGRQFNTLSINENSILFISNDTPVNLRLLQEFIDDFEDNYKDMFKDLLNDTSKEYTLELSKCANKYFCIIV